MTTGSLTTIGSDGEPDPRVPVTFRLSEPPTDVAAAYSLAAREVRSDADGLLQAEFLKSAWYIGRNGSGPEVAFFTGTADSFALPSLLSRADPL